MSDAADCSSAAQKPPPSQGTETKSLWTWFVFICLYFELITTLPNAYYLLASSLRSVLPLPPYLPASLAASQIGAV
jgi:hypothetical protein